MTSIIEFLEARITEDEDAATAGISSQEDPENGWGYEGRALIPHVGIIHEPVQAEHITRWHPYRVLAECAAKRAIIAQHQAWPVLAEQAPEYSTSDDGLNGISYRVNQQMMWLTEQEYVKKFGEAPPTAPMIRTLAAVYKDHPDYRPEWEA